MMHKNQIEKKFGGDAENIDVYWPYTPLNDPHFFIKEEMSNRLVSLDVYKQKLKNGELEGHKILPG